MALIKISGWLASPWAFGLLALLALILAVTLRGRRWTVVKDSLESFLWGLPVLGELWQSVVAVRFLSVFSLTYDCGLPVTQCLVLAASATGSKLAHERGQVMKDELVRGGTLKDAFEAGEFLPSLALEAVEAGQQSGKVSAILENSSTILKTEIRSKVEATTKLIEPLILSILGIFVGVFALGCLLPIIRLAETL